MFQLTVLATISGEDTPPRIRGARLLRRLGRNSKLCKGIQDNQVCTPDCKAIVSCQNENIVKIAPCFGSTPYCNPTNLDCTSSNSSCKNWMNTRTKSIPPSLKSLTNCKENTFTPDLLDCTKFNYCKSNYLFKYSCTSGTTFDPTSNSCNQHANCEIYSDDASCSGKTGQLVPYAYNETMYVFCGPNNKPILNACPESSSNVKITFNALTQNCEAKCKEEGKFKDPSDKTEKSYYNCKYFGTELVASRNSCPGGTIFWECFGVCAYPNQNGVTCETYEANVAQCNETVKDTPKEDDTTAVIAPSTHTDFRPLQRLFIKNKKIPIFSSTVLHTPQCSIITETITKTTTDLITFVSTSTSVSTSHAATIVITETSTTTKISSSTDVVPSTSTTISFTTTVTTSTTTTSFTDIIPSIASTTTITSTATTYTTSATTGPPTTYTQLTTTITVTSTTSITATSKKTLPAITFTTSSCTATRTIGSGNRPTIYTSTTTISTVFCYTPTIEVISTVGVPCSLKNAPGDIASIDSAPSLSSAYLLEPTATYKNRANEELFGNDDGSSFGFHGYSPESSIPTPVLQTLHYHNFNLW